MEQLVQVNKKLNSNVARFVFIYTIYKMKKKKIEKRNIGAMYINENVNPFAL